MAKAKLEFIMSAVHKSDYLDALMKQRDENIKNGLPIAVNTGIDQAIGILNAMMENRGVSL